MCTNVTSEQMICKSPEVPPKSRIVRVWFEMDNVHIDFHTIKNKPFTYHPNPDLFQLNSESHGTAIRFKPGGVLAVEVHAFLFRSVSFKVHQYDFSIILCTIIVNNFYSVCSYFNFSLFLVILLFFALFFISFCSF